MILGVIPARGGSKGLPGKNIRLFCDRPLLAWSVDAARESQLIDRFVVSTDDDDISAVAQAEGAEVLARPPELATDDATTVSVLMHVLEHIPADVVVLLQPTSPIRVNRLVDLAIQRFLETGVDSLATGYNVKTIEWGTHNNLSRQNIKGFFYDDGNVYVHRTDVLRKGNWYGERLEYMVVEHCYNLEIDDQIDFWAMEAVMQELLNGK